MKLFIEFLSDFNLIADKFQNKDIQCTLYLGNLDVKVNEEILWELFLQVGPLVSVFVPKDKIDYHHYGYGFIEFLNEYDADYAIKILNPIKLYNKILNINKLNYNQNMLDIGANIFIGNLSEDVDEKLLYDTFSAFGVIISLPKIIKNESKKGIVSCGFISYDSFESSDSAVYAMNGQFFCGNIIIVTYSFIKNTNKKHGTSTERMLSESKKVLTTKQ